MPSDFNIADFGPCSCSIRKHWSKEETVPHWRSLVESKYLSHFELQGKDCSVTIRSIRLSEVTGTGGKKSKKAVLTLEGKEKGAVMGVTCLRAIAGIYGDDYEQWIGKRITLYPTTTEASGETVGTIRVRPTAPAPSRGKAAAREPGSDDDGPPANGAA